MAIPKKSLGQNFLMHARIAERIVSVSEVTQSDTVVEIGPGTGMLTRALLARVHKVIAVEADNNLVTKLQVTFAQEIKEGRLILVHEDIRSFSIEKYFSAKKKDVSYSLVANIPYYITGEILRKFLSGEYKPVSMTVLVQKEVAERIARLDAKKPKESILSISVKAYGIPQYCFTVPRGAFFPAPNVDSAVLSIQNIKKDAFLSQSEDDFFFLLLKTGFAHKRKRLAKNLEELFSLEIVAQALEGTNLPRDVRAEDISVSAWRKLAHLLFKK